MLALQVPKLPWDLGVEYSFWGGLGGLTPIRPLSTPLLLLTQKKKYIQFLPDWKSMMGDIVYIINTCSMNFFSLDIENWYLQLFVALECLFGHLVFLLLSHEFIRLDICRL